MDSIKRLQTIFSRFPTIGQRTAGRFVMYLLKLPDAQVNELIEAIQQLKKNMKLCSLCFNPFEPFYSAQGTGQLCSICQNPMRQKSILCLVEKEADLQSIENAGRYQGLYFILGGAGTFRKEDLENLRIAPLKLRIAQDAAINEIIMALNPTPEGKAASVLVLRSLQDLPNFENIKITRLAQGLPVGGELEYADEETLQSAFEGRK